VLLLDDPATKVGEHQFQTLAHGVLQLEHFVPEFGAKRRRIQVIKLRGQNVDGAYHDFALRTGGITVYPRLVVADHRLDCGERLIKSGVAELDELLGGGVCEGTSTLILGASGTGKSTLSAQYVHQALKRGERAAVFLFDERLATFVQRARALGMGFEPYMREGTLTMRQIDPAELSPGEFACAVAECVNRDGVKIIVIDSLNGYLNAMPQARFLLTQMHELLTFLAQKGVNAFLVVAQSGTVTEGGDAPVDLSYLADSVIWLRYFEYAGQVRKAISVIKNRTGAHEPNIREVQITGRGLRVGKPLSEFHGVLTGNPTYHGENAKIQGAIHDAAGK
jgi:circadian clock protein KaiC